MQPSLRLATSSFSPWSFVARCPAATRMGRRCIAQRGRRRIKAVVEHSPGSRLTSRASRAHVREVRRTPGPSQPAHGVLHPGSSSASAQII